MPRRARMHGSGHRRLLKNSFFSNLLEVIHKITALETAVASRLGPHFRRTRAVQYKQLLIDCRSRRDFDF
jgi:hypothetical protein